MFRIVALDPYSAEPTGSYGKEYHSKSKAIGIVEDLIQEARNLPYGELKYIRRVKTVYHANGKIEVS